MSSNVHKGLRMYINCLKMYFKNSLIMHEENTKKNNKRVVSLYVIFSTYTTYFFESYFIY